MRTLITTIGALLLTSALATAGEKKLMHCFAFTPRETATEADFKAWYAAMDQLPKKVPGISRVWYGKLRAPLQQFSVDSDASKKLREGAAEADAKAKRTVRQHGACMEMDSADALKAYDAHPYHKEWIDIYDKVRVPGTTTFDVIGQ